MQDFRGISDLKNGIGHSFNNVDELIKCMEEDFYLHQKMSSYQPNDSTELWGFWGGDQRIYSSDNKESVDAFALGMAFAYYTLRPDIKQDVIDWFKECQG